MEDSVPGGIVEQIIALVHGAQVLNTYDYVDVVIEGDKGWQVKSTKESTPVTWKRAKIPNKTELIAASLSSESGLQALGNEIIRFCNAHAHHSMSAYNLSKIMYSRCVLMKSGEVKYFERELCNRSRPDIFNESDFSWAWSVPKKTTKKEQLSALHGTHKHTGHKMWAWHGHGENQLHFSGEGSWWDDPSNTVSFTMPPVTRKMTWNQFFNAISP